MAMPAAAAWSAAALLQGLCLQAAPSLQTVASLCAKGLGAARAADLGTLQTQSS
jgi:hypothetical protein